MKFVLTKKCCQYIYIFIYIYIVIVLVEMPLSRFEECWPLPTESLPELTLKPQYNNPNPNTNPKAFGQSTLVY